MMRFIAVLLFFITSCSKSIELDMQEYQPQLVVECYLEPGKPYQLLLQETMVYTDAPGIRLVNDALVIISHSGRSDTLLPQEGVDLISGKAYNYASPVEMTEDYYSPFTLYIRDGKGRLITGETRLLPKIPIDTVYFTLEDDNEYRLYARILDPADKENYYRHITTRLTMNDSSRTDFMISDATFNGEYFDFFTYRSEYNPGDSALTLIFNLPEDYYEFLQSVDDAGDANGNPYGQPSVIRSNVSGGIGIFTALSYSAALSVAP